MNLYVEANGTVRGIYSEEIDLTALGRVTIRRASHVEPDEQGRWWADLGPVRGPRLGPFTRRSLALAAETAWLGRKLLHGRKTWLALADDEVANPREVFTS